MSETIIVAIMGVVGPIIGAVISLKSVSYKSKNEIQHKNFEAKREHLDTIYKRLISIINLYPNSSPNDVLKWVEYPPNYSMEWFDTVLKSLDYQIDDYRDKLENENIDYELKSNIEIQISNREYSKKRISEIEKDYSKAKEEYKNFCTSEKTIFDLYAGQKVKNILVEFEVVIHNVFISGRSVGGDVDDPLKNIIDILRRNLINSMREDLGLY